MEQELNNTILVDKKKKKILSSLIPAILILLILVLGCLVFILYKKTQILQANPVIQNEKVVKDIVEKVGSIIYLPQGEIPVVITITDKKTIEGSQFFTNATLGDQILVYNSARKAYLYRPSQSILIDVLTLVY